MKLIKSFAVLCILLTFQRKTASAQVVWGVDSSRTEYRDDAGLQGNAGAKSGFYNALKPVNFPAGATNWWHLLDVRHSGATNNYAMQFAGSFFDQSLYFRKTNNNPAQTWSRVLTETDGKVGIGISNAADKLHIQGSTTSLRMNPDFHGGSYIYSYNDTVYTPLVFQSVNFQVLTGTNALTERLRVTESGNVGIGTSNPQEKLSVNGNILAKRVRVSQNWADYVFDPAYTLKPLNEVHHFIQANKHLPDMPAAKVIEQEGLDLGEIIKQQQVKIEELTLYVIDQDKRSTAQQALIEQQAALLKQLESQVQQLQKSRR
ncbi:hypothetical protein [Chitinophaga vietnamensis]|uniref:hypothetical protein n=1 Tax=Chitinophaga vietnamensis TaxID=2593957 RepID=UPI00191C5B66|nr:hypothetical protein [Chitinophaga vietnamensis]